MNMTPEILVVDDQKFTHVLLNKALSDLQVHTVSAFTGEQALEQLAVHDFCVVLMDLHMPGMDGLEAAQKIRKNKRTADLPIIFITAATGDEDKAMQAYLFGAVDFLYKPVSVPALKSKVSTFVELYRRRRELQQRNEQYRDILESVAEGLVTVDMDWRIIETNDSACALFGYGHAELQGKTIPEVLFQEDRDIIEAINTQLETNVTFQVESQARKRNGSLFWVDFRGSILMHRGAPHILAVTQDITAKKMTEQELKRLQNKLAGEQDTTQQDTLAPHEHPWDTPFTQTLQTVGEAVLATLDRPAFIQNPQGYILCCNAHFTRLYETTSTALVGSNSVDLLPEDLANFIDEKNNQLMESQAPQDFTLPLYMPSGNRREFLVSRTIINDEQGTPTAFFTLLTPQEKDIL